jgi:hypothetical protein
MLANLLNLLTVTSVELAGGIALALGAGSAERSIANYPFSSPNSLEITEPNVRQNPATKALASLLTELALGRTFASQDEVRAVEIHNQRMAEGMGKRRANFKTKETRKMQGDRKLRVQPTFRSTFVVHARGDAARLTRSRVCAELFADWAGR